LNYAVTFTTDPPTSGIISCNSTSSDLWHDFKNNDYLRIDDGKGLACNTNVNFNGLYPMVFDSWSGSLVNSSTPHLILTISRSGTLTAHFREIVPHDIITGIVLAGITALASLSVRAFALRRREKERKKLQERWIEIIDSEYNRLRDNKDECLHRLAEIREDIMHMYADGTMPKNHFEELDKQIARFENNLS
jgi:hypothetical protein